MKLLLSLLMTSVAVAVAVCVPSLAEQTNPPSSGLPTRLRRRSLPRTPTEDRPPPGRVSSGLERDHSREGTWNGKKAKFVWENGTKEIRLF